MSEQQIDYTPLIDAGTAARNAIAHRNKLIKQYRKRKISYRDIAEQVGLSHTGVRKIVRDGEP